MPIYEYACEKCGQRGTVFFTTLASARRARPTCPHCGSDNLSRLISRVVFHKKTAWFARFADMRLSGALDESDPRMLGRWARVGGEAVGKDLGSDWEDTVRSLESGDTQGSVEVAPPGGFQEPGPDLIPDADWEE